MFWVGAISLGAVSQAIGVPEAILGSAALQALFMMFFELRTSPGRREKIIRRYKGRNKAKRTKGKQLSVQLRIKNRAVVPWLFRINQPAQVQVKV